MERIDNYFRYFNRITPLAKTKKETNAEQKERKKEEQTRNSNQPKKADGIDFYV